MAQTTTAVNACDVVFSVDDIALALIDMSGSTNGVTIDLTRDQAEATTFDGAWKIRLECKKDASISWRALYSTDDTEAIGLLKDWFNNGGDRSIQLDIPSGAGGNDRYTGEFKLASLNIVANSGDAGPIPVVAELRPNGAVTIAQIAS